MESNDRYLPPVNGRPGPIDPEKVWEDPAILVAAIASAVEFVEKLDRLFCAEQQGLRREHLPLFPPYYYMQSDRRREPTQTGLQQEHQ